MRTFFLFLAAGLCGAGSCLAAEPNVETARDLLTTQDESGRLAGWKSFLAADDPDIKTGDVWRLRGGVLQCNGTPQGYIYTRKKYQDFVLKLQWRWPPGEEPGRGGVLVRMSGPHQIWPKSLEAQINAGQAGDFWGLAGYPLKGPAERTEVVEHPDLGRLTHVNRARDAERPAGEWNQYEIIADGGTVTLKINGKVVNRATGCPTEAGPICLTAEGDPIEFREVKIQVR